MDESNSSLEGEWDTLLKTLSGAVGRKPKDLNEVLFLVGIQELGKGPQNFTKEQKQDLMHIATCKVLSLSGYYELEKLDEDGWPHWKVAIPFPKGDLAFQESLLKMHVLEYFKQEGLFS